MVPKSGLEAIGSVDPAENRRPGITGVHVLPGAKEREYVFPSIFLLRSSQNMKAAVEAESQSSILVLTDERTGEPRNPLEQQLQWLCALLESPLWEPC